MRDSRSWRVILFPEQSTSDGGVRVQTVGRGWGAKFRISTKLHCDAEVGMWDHTLRSEALGSKGNPKSVVIMSLDSGIWQTSIQIAASPLMSCVTLGLPLSFSVLASENGAFPIVLARIQGDDSGRQSECAVQVAVLLLLLFFHNNSEMALRIAEFCANSLGSGVRCVLGLDFNPR